MAPENQKTAFATVGTTSFDALVDQLISKDFLQTLHEQDYQRLVIQYGRGITEPQSRIVHGVEVRAYRYKPSIREDLENADLVIGHAGAGSVLETLTLNKRLLVVVNETLMDNHQAELAEEFASQGFLHWTTVSKLPTVFPALDWRNIKKYQPGKPELFAQYIDDFFGI
ncbi:hypothetical protein RvY_13445 [Ramazzottius varieornatus]|uniref:UDP-N-acetylglucosamine transferase subunit ALG13 n=1 Tax=Ramazzottius varieornatus TaxID=947166 RepID=A0A1D1VRX7_RAMVA|nr:hypothetical protein RvY_13445 [Ramazzottius varieornatus]